MRVLRQQKKRVRQLTKPGYYKPQELLEHATMYSILPLNTRYKENTMNLVNVANLKKSL